MKDDQEFVKLARWGGKKKKSKNNETDSGLYQGLVWLEHRTGWRSRREEGSRRFSSKVRLWSKEEGPYSMKGIWTWSSC